MGVMPKTGSVPKSCCAEKHRKFTASWCARQAGAGCRISLIFRRIDLRSRQFRQQRCVSHRRTCDPLSSSLSASSAEGHRWPRRHTISGKSEKIRRLRTRVAGAWFWCRAAALLRAQWVMRPQAGERLGVRPGYPFLLAALPIEAKLRAEVEGAGGTSSIEVR